MNKHHVCTLGLALALAQPWHIAQAASHCKSLEASVCGTTAACKFQPARAVGDKTKAGGIAKTAAKAHCRLDVAAAAKLAAETASKGR